MRFPSGMAIIAIVCCATSAASAGSAPGPSVHPSIGMEVYGWPFGMGCEGALWLDAGPFLAAVHLTGGVLRKQYDPAEGEDVSAFLGSYGIRAGMTLPWITGRPFALVGYDRVGSASTEAELGTSGGRTEQNVNLEIGGRFTANQVEVVIGMKGSVPFAQQTHPFTPGPPLPRAALFATLRI